MLSSFKKTGTQEVQLEEKHFDHDQDKLETLKKNMNNMFTSMVDKIPSIDFVAIAKEPIPTELVNSFHRYTFYQQILFL